MNGFIRVSDGTKYLIIFGFEKLDVIFNRIRYLTGLINHIEYVFSYNLGTIKKNLDDYLPLEKTLSIMLQYK